MSVIDILQFNKTEMFAKIRAGLLPKQHTSNLLECKDDLIFAWDQSDCTLLVVNWRLSQVKNIQYQTLVPSSPQNFDVERLIISNEGSLIALAGPRGVAILELPRRWGKDGQFMNGKASITCRTHCLDALLFGNNPHLEVRQLRFHPGSTTDSHLLVLLSDNTIRFYNNSQLRNVWQVGPLPSKGTQSGHNSSFGIFGEAAVDFDIAPAVKLKSSQSTSILSDSNNDSWYQSRQNRSQVSTKTDKIEWPLVILRENGNIYILVTGMNSEKTRLQGPITITPQTVDNYGLDSCSILVVPSVPPALVIAESNGKLHHALLLELDSVESTYNEINDSLNIEPSEWSVHVLETVELELGLPKNQGNESQGVFTCPIHLKRDIINELRYFAYHNTGLHVITLNFIGEVQRYLGSEVADDKISLSTPSSAEYLVCTKIDAGDRINAILGFVILQMPSTLALLLSSGQVISVKVVIDTKLLASLTSTTTVKSMIADNNPNQLSEATSFVEHVRNMLQRNLTQPILSADKSSNPSPHECYELLNQAIDVLRAQYLKRHDDVRTEFSKRISRIRLQKEQQLREIENLEREREVISERAHKLAERIEEINDNQDVLMKKCHDLMRQANIVLPGKVAAEEEFANEVALINKSTKCMATALDHAKKSIEKQRYHMAKGNATKREVFELPEKQHRIITEILTQMASEIERQIRDVKRINNLIGI